MGTRRFLPLLAAALATALLAPACASPDDVASDQPMRPAAASADTTTTSKATTTTDAPPPSTTTTEAPAPPEPAPVAPPTTEPPAPVDPTLRQGASGQAVRDLQARLGELGYWLGTPDGTYGGLTTQAVLAFQKAEGLGRDGVAGPATLAALEGAGRPQGRSTAGRVIEIDLARQLLLVVEDGLVREALNTSTGTAATPTPPGRFAVDRRIDGIRRAPLGDLYRPAYFNRGIAVHGSPSIPGYPASHGCARVHDAVMDHLWAAGFVAVGTAVHVY